MSRRYHEGRDGTSAQPSKKSATGRKANLFSNGTMTSHQDPGGGENGTIREKGEIHPGFEKQDREIRSRFLEQAEEIEARAIQGCK